MPPPTEGRTSRGVGGGGGGVGEEQAKEGVAGQASLGTQRNTDLHASQATASSPLKAIQAPGHLGHSGGHHLGHSGGHHLGNQGGQHLGSPGGQEVSAPGRARSGP